MSTLNNNIKYVYVQGQCEWNDLLDDWDFSGMVFFALNGFVSNIIDCRLAVFVDLRLRLYN